MADGARRRRPPRGAYGIVVGFLAGVVVASVFARDAEVERVSAGRDSSSAGDSGLAAGAAPADGALGGAVVDGAPTPGGTGATGGPRGAPGQPGAPPPTGARSASAGPLPNAQGVTDTKIKVGVALAEAGAFESVARLGDVRGHPNSVVATWREKGLVPVHGRDVELVFRSYDISRPEAQRAACVAFAQDDRVFAVIAAVVFSVGAECLAREFKIPVVTSAGTIPDDTFFQRTHPFAFYTNMSDTRVGRNWVHWAHSLGLLKNKRIGLYYPDDAASVERVNRSVKAELSRLGYQVAADVAGPDGSEALAVQRFRTAQVDLAMIMGGTGTGGTNRQQAFTQAAGSQAYRPTYLASEFMNSGVTADGLSDLYNADQWDGTLAMTYYHRATGTRPGDAPVPAIGQECVENYRRHSGRTITKQDNANEWDVLQHTCDQGRALMTGFVNAGRAITALGFVGALERTFKDQPSGVLSNLTFAPDKHDGAGQVKTIRWSRGCRCWTHVSGFQPLWR